MTRHVKPITWAERVVLYSGWRPNSKGWIVGLSGCLVFAAIQLIAYAGKEESWRLWACALFIMTAASGFERHVLHGLLARAESRLAELEGHDSPPTR